MTSVEIQRSRDQVERALEREESVERDDKGYMKVYLRAYVSMDNLVKSLIQEAQEREAHTPPAGVNVSILLIGRLDDATQDKANEKGQEGHGSDDRERLQCDAPRRQEEGQDAEALSVGQVILHARANAIANALRLYGPEYFHGET